MVLAAGFIITLITMGFELKLCRQKSNNVVVKVVKISAAAELPNNDKTDKTVAGAKEQK